MKQADLKKYFNIIKIEVSSLVSTLREKGAKHFGRPLGIGAAVVFGVYFFAYRPTAAHLAEVDAELSGLSVSVKYAPHYQELADRLQIYSSDLPKVQDKDSWLLNTVREAMKAEGVYFTSISPVNEQQAPGYTLLTLTVSGSATYKQFAMWISRLERGQSFLHIAHFSLVKGNERLGMDQIELTVVAAIPKGTGA